MESRLGVCRENLNAIVPFQNCVNFLESPGGRGGGLKEAVFILSKTPANPPVLAKIRQRLYRVGVRRCPIRVRLCPDGVRLSPVCVGLCPIRAGSSPVGARLCPIRVKPCPIRAGLSPVGVRLDRFPEGLCRVRRHF
jgi:hypothetical protein